jgi:hypothetical protein
MLGGTQSASSRQLDRQLFPSQVKGVHSSGSPLMQAPSPSHSPPGTKVRGPEQEEAPQGVLGGYLAQPP